MNSFWSLDIQVLRCMLSVTEEEFQTLAENLRPHMERAMKIEVAPWIKEYVTDMAIAN